MVKQLAVWNSDFSVNNKNLDRQHEELLWTVNSFYAACQRGGGPTKAHFLKTFQGLLNYAKTHFSDEEELMLKAGYPDLDTHRNEHRDFVTDIMGQIRDFEEGESPDSAALVKILGDWVHDHVASTDKKYVPYIANLNQGRVSPPA